MKQSLHAFSGLVAMFLAPYPTVAQEVTAEAVVEACAEAMGGRARIDSVHTLRFLYTLPDHGGSQSRTDVKRPNLVRLGDDVVFDGQRAARLSRGPTAGGAHPPSELMDPEEWKDFEIDIGRYFPAFFDYPAEYRGVENIEGVETHKLEVLLPKGGQLTYFVEVATSLPLMVESQMTMYGRKYKGQRMYGGYREVDGVLLPYEFSYYSPHWRRLLYLEMDEVRVNPEFGEGHFQLPEEIGRSPVLRPPERRQGPAS